MRAGHPSRFLLFLLVPVLAAGCAGHRLAGSPPGGREPLVLAEVLASDTTLSGEVVLADDLIIPEGVTLTLTPGTTVIVEPSDGTRTDPQFLSTGTEVVVRGALNVPKGPVTFRPRGAAGRGAWGGIALTGPSAEANLEGAVVQGAEFGLIALAGSARVGNSTFDGCEVGLAASRQAEVATESNTFTGNGAAAMALLGARVPSGPGDTFQGNDDDVIAQDGSGQDIITTGFVPDTPPPGPVTREYLGEMAMTEDTTWSGTVVVEGQLAVMPEVTLTIEPGTRVLFRFRDTNGDGLGESWIICQGRLRVLGEEDAWVLFDAEEDGAGPGSWDSLSIIASEAPDNLIRYAVFRRGTKALHTHFSRLEAHHLVFEENLRGVQFQESESTTLDRVHLRGNLSAMRFRDSTVRLSNILAEENAAGLNFLRASVTIEDVLVSGSPLESLVSRESDTFIQRAVFTGNRRGPRFKGEGQRITLLQSAVVANQTEGLSLNGVRASLSQSDLSRNGFTGLSVSDAQVTVRGSRISGNGRYEVDNNGSTPVDAGGNDWGAGKEPDPAVIYDGSDEEGIGPVLTGDPLRFALAFPGMELPAGSVAGTLLVVGDVVVPGERDVVLDPGSRVLFAAAPPDSLFDLCSDHPAFPSSELLVLGRLKALGTGEQPIRFLPALKDQPPVVPDLTAPALWGGVNLVGGKGGEVSHALFTGAATGIHAREAGDVSVTASVFEGNLVGMRFSLTDVRLRDNLFRGNGTGLRFHDRGGLVQDNTFEGNGTGVFVTQNPTGVTLRGNTFRNSRDYHVKLGVHATEDVTVRGGALVIPHGMTAADLIFDREDDPELGRVIVVP